MRRLRRGPRHAATAFAVLGLASTAPAGQAPAARRDAAVAQGLWYQSYDQGVRAANAGNWTLAIPALESAKRGGPAPGRRVLFQGDRVDVFNPDYYLGLAYNATRRFAEAEAAFRRVVDDGLVRQGDREFETLRTQQARATYERTVLDGERAVDGGRYVEAEKALQSVVGTLAGDDRAAKLIARARSASAAATVASTEPTPTPGTPPDYNPPPVATNLPANPPTTNPAGQTAIEPDKTPPGIEKQIADATGTPPNRPDDSGRDPGGTTPRPPTDQTQATLAGLTAYHAGDYERAVQLLQPLYAIDPQSPTVAFYLACSRVARGILAGGLDQSTTDEARRLFAGAQGDGPRFAADRAVISPVVLNALGSTASATTQRASAS